MADLFYGPYKIIKEERDEASQTVLLTFAPQPESALQKLNERVSLTMYDAAVTDKATDHTNLRELRIRPVVKEMMKTILNWNLKISEIEFLMMKLTGSVNEAQGLAMDLLWGQPEYERSMLEVDQIIRKHADKLPNANKPA